jgi:hypothetical protein
MTDALAALRQKIEERLNKLSAERDEGRAAFLANDAALLARINALAEVLHDMGAPSTPAPAPKPQRAARGSLERRVLEWLEMGPMTLADLAPMDKEAFGRTLRRLVKAKRVVQVGGTYRLPAAPEREKDAAAE